MEDITSCTAGDSQEPENPENLKPGLDCSLARVRQTVEKHFPTLWPAVEVGLSTCATLLLADNANPVALIYVGPAGAGKTTIASMFDGAKVNGQDLCVRSDKFTTASFLSHSAKATSHQLKEIDLLPRIKNKVFLTPELSTIFRGKEDELAERFAIITRVLDGQGLVTHSGTHGQRDCAGDYLFAWIGCTTPFSPSVWRIMGQLGSRMFFLVMDAVAKPSVEELVQALNQPDSNQQALANCKQAVHQHLESLFTQYGDVRGVQWTVADRSPRVLETISRCATLLAVMRTPDDKWDGKPPHPESPHRANAVLYNLARGHALVYGRTWLSTEDMPMIAQVTLSSMPAERKAVLVARARNQGDLLTVAQVEEATGVSRHTAERIMEDLDWLGIMKFEKEGVGRPSQLSIRSEWEWIVSGDFGALLVKASTWQKSGGESQVAMD